MKPQLTSSQPLDKLTFPLLAQLKHDGIRVIARKMGDVVALTTRNELGFVNSQLEAAIRALPIKSVILDGELVVKHLGDEQREVARTRVSGLVSSSIKLDKDFSMDNLEYVIFDLPDFKGPQSDRTKKLEAMIPETDMLRVVDTVQVHNTKAVQKMLATATRDGHEGIVLKKPREYYCHKTPRSWIKFKVTKSVELVCKEYEFGKACTKYRNDIGSLLCSGVVEGKPVVVSVSSGMTDYDRGLMPTDYLGKTIEVKYSAVIPAQVGAASEWTLHLPRFMCVRCDK